MGQRVTLRPDWERYNNIVRANDETVTKMNYKKEKEEMNPVISKVYAEGKLSEAESVDRNFGAQITNTIIDELVLRANKEEVLKRALEMDKEREEVNKK